MKKFTLTLFVFISASGLVAQTFSTGTFQLRPNYSAQIDVSPDLVTLTQTGPSDRWFSLAFNNGSMSNGDIVVFIDTPNISDRNLIGFQVPSEDAIQNWTTIFNEVVSGVRKVVSTRVLNTGEVGDFIFSNTAGSINVGWSMAASANFTLGSHGGGSNAGHVTAGLTLGSNSFATDSFKMYPNPSAGKTTIELPNYITSATIKIYDTLGRMIKSKNITFAENTIDTADLTHGNYLVVVRTDYGNDTKTLIVN